MNVSAIVAPRFESSGCPASDAQQQEMDERLA